MNEEESQQSGGIVRNSFKQPSIAQSQNNTIFEIAKDSTSSGHVSPEKLKIEIYDDENNVQNSNESYKNAQINSRQINNAATIERYIDEPPSLIEECNISDEESAILSLTPPNEPVVIETNNNIDDQ